MVKVNTKIKVICYQIAAQKKIVNNNYHKNTNNNQKKMQNFKK